MFGLTTLGSLHTAISLVALFAGFLSLLRAFRIDPRNRLGQVYVWSTVLTCATGFGIFQRGGFNEAHVLGIVTLVVLGVASLPGALQRFGSRWHYVATACYTLTLFFHMVPGITETFTRVPVGAPLFSSPDDPALARTVGVVFMVFLVVIALQLQQVRGRIRRGDELPA
jgi:uncharacterized membrane protein